MTYCEKQHVSSPLSRTRHLARLHGPLGQVVPEAPVEVPYEVGTANQQNNFSKKSDAKQLVTRDVSAKL